MSRRTYFAELTDAPVEDPAGFALPPVRSVVLDRAEALEEDAREAEEDRHATTIGTPTSGLYVRMTVTQGTAHGWTIGSPRTDPVPPADGRETE